MKYETLVSTLERYSNTLLGDRKKRLAYYIPSKNTYFFRRNIQSFEAILYYYQSGKGFYISMSTLRTVIVGYEYRVLKRLSAISYLPHPPNLI